MSKELIEREELWLEGGAIRFVYTDEYVEQLRAALRDVKKNIETVFYGRWLDEQGPPIHKAIITINKVLGEE